METFLGLCDDAESDVRMVGDECINRSIKVRVVMETFLGLFNEKKLKKYEVKESDLVRYLSIWIFFCDTNCSYIPTFYIQFVF